MGRIVGYEGICGEKGTYVPANDAYAYAIERCLNGTEAEREEFKQMVVEWFYSGNWVWIEEGENVC